MNKSLFSNTTYLFLFFLLGIVYVAGLFVPLMNNDSGHHALIALHMHLTGDYVSLIDRQQAYLDKPHLLFWLAAFSYKIFGVNAFAYKLPSFLFTLLGTYSTYRLGKSLYDKETGKLAALVVASAFAYVIANNDVRMDAILTASVAFATWQIVEFIQNKKLLNVVGAALGLALGFATKGHIAVFVVVVSAFFYILYLKEWKILFNPKWILLIILFGLFISPVVYCYYLQFNLHSETIVRGRNNIDGVSFILWGQSIDRFSGGMGDAGSKDYLFFFHSFLWAFAPWSFVAFAAFFQRIKTIFKRNEEWLTTGLFAVMMVIITFSQFKLPHYLNIIFPATALMTAAYIITRNKSSRTLYAVQAVLSILLVLLGIILNVWAFPVDSILVIAVAVLLFALVIYAFVSKQLSYLQRAVLLPVLSSVFVLFLLNANFYPKLLTYQGGNQLAKQHAGKVDVNTVYHWGFTDDYSWYFGTVTLPKAFADSVVNNGKKVWVLSDSSQVKEITRAGYVVGQQYGVTDYHITRLKLKFINPDKRAQTTSQLVLSEVYKKEE